MFILGLTGSIGMGKTTTAILFKEEGVSVHDADATVHQLYEGEAAPLIERAFPHTTRNGRVDRAALSKIVLGNDVALKQLEALVHPLVRKAEAEFVRDEQAKGVKIVVLDIPLLFETGAESRCDAVAVVSASPEIQRLRAFERPGMTAKKFAAVMANQMPDAEKRVRADFIVDSGQGIERARGQVRKILEKIAKMSNKK